MSREEWEMQLISPLPWQTSREPTEMQIEMEAQGFYDLLHKSGGGA